MKKFFSDLTRITVIKLIVGSLFFLLFLGCFITIHIVKNNLVDQNFAKRWASEGGFAQVSCFYAENEAMSADYFVELEHTIDTCLLDASLDVENEKGRLWISSLSLGGSVLLKSEKASVEVNSLGVSGDFFQFHPVKLKYGSYFSDSNLMQDGVIIDEEIAWQLFGASNVVGMQIVIHEIPHYIIGVVERADDYLSMQAGLNSPLCYLSLNSLQKYGTTYGGFTYEVLLPNPISGYALSVMTDHQSLEEKQIEIVENSERYSPLSLVFVISEFGTRSMSQKGIIYPYFENVARGWEDILSMLFLVSIVALMVPVVFIMIWLMKLWKERTFSSRDIKVWLIEQKEKVRIIRYDKKNNKYCNDSNSCIKHSGLWKGFFRKWGFK